MPSYTLYWAREDKHGDFHMGEFSTRAEAVAATTAALAELVRQCTSQDDINAIHTGGWSIVESGE